MVVTGTNGSGKSTMLRVIAGLLPAISGKVIIQGLDEEAPCELMHYLGHLNGLKPALSVSENLNFWQQYCGTAFMEVNEALEAVALPGIGHLPAGYLSAGQKRRVSIAKLLVSFKPVWIVDEPTAALDNASENLFSNLVDKHLGAGGIVVAATHKPLAMTVAKSLNMDDMPANDPRPDGYLL